MQAATYMPYACAGNSWCRFRCGETSMGNCELTDGVYVWPEGFLHYVQVHHVKPPQQFINHVLNYSPFHFIIDDYSSDTNWWTQQQGYNHMISTAKHPTDFGVLEIIPETIRPLHRQKIENVLWDFLYPVIGYKKAKAAIIDVLAGKAISITGEFPAFDSLRTDCMVLGVKVNFTMTE